MSQYIGHFCLWGDFDPDEITKKLGLKPSSVDNKGEMWEGANFPSQVSGWDLHCPPDLTLDEQIEFLLDLLLPRAVVLQLLAAQFTAELNVICTNGVLNLKFNTINRLAHLGVGLNCFYEQEGDEDAT